MQTCFPTNFATIWQTIAEHISAQVTKDTYHRWFKGVMMTAADENDITLTVPNNIYQLWIESNYLAVVQSAVASVLGGPRAIHFAIALPEHAPAAGKSHLREEPEIEVIGEPEPRTMSDSLFDEDEIPVIKPEPKPRNHTSREGTAPASTGMNPRNTFDTFVVGANNQFAHAASLAVAQAPARTYNPLFVYGGVGLGKTHLMHAIGQHAALRGASSKVMYLSSEKFTNEFIDAIQNNSLVKFRKKYRQADLLLIDDIQFFSGKERSQEEFFHTFNTLFDGHKQIVLSSDRPPAEIANLEQRLVSRFEWGLTAELQPPDIETRLAILRKKAESLTIKLESNILEFLAQRIRTNASAAWRAR